jgi:hypothetical protein
METLHSFERGDTEVRKVSAVECHFSAFGVSVALLARLSSLQAISDELDLFFRFSKYIRPEHLTFSSLGPIERGATLAPIECFKRCHLEAGLVAVIIRELGERQTILPFGSVSQNTGAEHILQNLIHPLRLSTCLRMISSTKGELGSQSFM